jgi:HK97 family phage major capsid protein
MSDQITDIENTVHEYRRTLDRFAARTGADTQHVEIRGSGEEREKIARIDADLDAVERQAQDRAALRAANERIAHLEAERAQPQFRATLPNRREAGCDASSPEYAMRWLKAIARGDSQELRVLTTSTSGAGIPTDMERRIVEKMYQVNVLRQMCPITNIDSKRTLTVEGSLPTAAKVADNGAVTASDPSFATAISITPIKYVCATTMTQEFIDDAIGQGGIGAGLDWVASRIGLALSQVMEEAYTVGDGTGDPQGIAFSGVVTQGVDLGAGVALSTVSGDNIIDAVHAVNPAYRSSPRFSWLISDDLLKAVRKIKVNTTDYVWKVGEQGGLTNGAPGTIYGVPYRVGAYMPTATADGNRYAIVGDFNYFEIFDRTGMTSLIDPYSGAANLRTTLYTYMRTDSRCTNASAFAAIIG